MKYKGVTEIYEDIANKWRVRIFFDDNSSTFLKFQKKPSELEIITKANEYIVSKEKNIAEIKIKDDLQVINEIKFDLIKNISVDNLRNKLEL